MLLILTSIVGQDNKRRTISTFPFSMARCKGVLFKKSVIKQYLMYILKFHSKKSCLEFY